MGLIPKQTRSDRKVMKGLNVMRFFGLVITLMLSSMLGSFIGGWLRFVFMFFCVIVFFILIAKSPTNPNQLFIKGLLTYVSHLFDVKVMVGSSNSGYKKYVRDKEAKNAKSKKILKGKKPKNEDK